MANREQPYDPYISSGGHNDRTAALQSPGEKSHTWGQPARILYKKCNDYFRGVIMEIDDTVNHMRNNIQNISDRGERLDALQDKTDNLATSASGFRRGANRVRKQMWWKDMKMRICIIVGIIILLLIIIVPSVLVSKNK